MKELCFIKCPINFPLLDLMIDSSLLYYYLENVLLFFLVQLISSNLLQVHKNKINCKYNIIINKSNINAIFIIDLIIML